jgi:hypothetical protein
VWAQVSAGRPSLKVKDISTSLQYVDSYVWFSQRKGRGGGDPCGAGANDGNGSALGFWYSTVLDKIVDQVQCADLLRIECNACGKTSDKLKPGRRVLEPGGVHE